MDRVSHRARCRPGHGNGHLGNSINRGNRRTVAGPFDDVPSFAILAPQFRVLLAIPVHISQPFLSRLAITFAVTFARQPLAHSHKIREHPPFISISLNSLVGSSPIL